MQNFEMIAQICLYSLAGQNISDCVEFNFYEGKMSIFLMKIV